MIGGSQDTGRVDVCGISYKIRIILIGAPKLGCIKR